MTTTILPPTDLPLDSILPNEPLLLMGAGPVPVSQKVAMANSVVINHLGETMSQVIERVRLMSQYVFQTNSKHIIGVAGPGSAAMEMAITNLVWPGRKVLSIQNGFFSARLAEMAERNGGEVTVYEVPLGEGAQPEKVEALLKSGDFDVLTIVQGETSCTVWNQELEAITKKGEECIKELNEEFSSLINLYKSHCAIVSDHQMDDDIKIEAKVFVDAPKFDSFVSCYHKSGAIRTVVNDVQDDNGDYHFDVDTHAAFVEKTANTIRGSQSPTLRKNHSLKDAYKLLYADYFWIDFLVTYKNDSIVHMSPGKRGLVLLSLMLELSNSTHPILIDQPEDNLDNRTIYSELKDFVRKCKSKRQIIMVTHNAN